MIKKNLKNEDFWQDVSTSLINLYPKDILKNCVRLEFHIPSFVYYYPLTYMVTFD